MLHMQYMYVALKSLICAVWNKNDQTYRKIFLVVHDTSSRKHFSAIRKNIDIINQKEVYNFPNILLSLGQNDHLA